VSSAPALGNEVSSVLNAGMVSIKKWTRFHLWDYFAS
jgi:hypothetical protein